MPDFVASAIEGVAKTWRQEAQRRRAISASDAVADTLDYCAGELASRLRSLAAASEYETVEEVARREGVTPQTVREWCRTQQLPAEHGPKGYRIPKGAARVRRAG